MKKALLILSFIVFAAACDKHDDDYSQRYTLSYIRALHPSYKLCQADHFVQGYMSVSSVKIDRNIKIFPSQFHLYFSLEGDIVKGGNMKDDPCDEGFKQLAQKYDDVYGPYDVLSGADMERGVIMTADKMEYYVYLAKGKYPISQDDGDLLEQYIDYYFYTRDYKKHLMKWSSPSDPNVYTDWSMTALIYNMLDVGDFNASNYRDIDVTLIDAKRNRFCITLPKEAGVYSLRFVAKKDGKVIHDEIIEDLELPAFEYPFPVLTSPYLR
ncbi:MAG: hypothetical protein K2N21_06575 [Rikenellaceae bacterium]|nr:hypothetical protein [Rikenellaceae bacterium]